MTALDAQSVSATLDRMKMLFWRLDLLRRSFVNLNECAIGVLGRENYRFFKDREYREKLLFPDDRVLFDRAVTNFKERVPVRAVFRVQSESTIYWFKITGWPTHDYRYYEGAVEEITEHVGWLKNIFDQQDRRLLNVELEDYPVALFKEQDHQVFKVNPAFLALLGPAAEVNQRYRLEEMVSGDIKLPQLLENLLLERRIALDLQLGFCGGRPVRAFCQLEYFSHQGKGYVRLAVLDRVEENNRNVIPGVEESSKKDVVRICADLADCSSIDDMLERIYQAKELFPAMDVVMFSDIYAAKNKVVVYAKGDMSEPLEPGSQFPYTGTIAENIEKENLEYLIVDDTQSSIKAIDWMLFVPKGIYSYVAKALYVRGAMRTVLILCSRKKQAFREDQIAEVTAIATAFHQQLKKIRRKSRT